jgi:hypothetical protein
MKNITIYLMLIILLSDCKKDKQNDILQSGKFSLSKLEDFSSNTKSASLKQWVSENKITQDQYSFDLGEIKISKEFYFLLMNVGDMPIFDIVLSSNNPNFKISPTKINNLSSTKNLSDNNSNQILPLITVGIEHGKRIDGNGYGNLLNMGINNSIITISGKTILGNDTIDISCSPLLIVDAKIMDVNFYVDNHEVNLYDPTGSLSNSIWVLGTIPYYFIEFKNKPIKITNVGNTSITIEILGKNTETRSLAPNHSLDSLIVEGLSMALLKDDGMYAGIHAVFKFNSEGTAVKNDKLKLLSDGNAYFSIFGSRPIE